MSAFPILLGVTGSVSAPKAQSIVGALKHAGFEVRAAMTPSACRLIGSAALTAILPKPPYIDIWRNPGDEGGEAHITWAEWAGAMVIAPTTASCISDLRTGSYNSAVTLLAANVDPNKLFIAPAMSECMWNQPAVQENVEVLMKWGVRVLGPNFGQVASGKEGYRLLEPREIAAALSAALLS